MLLGYGPPDQDLGLEAEIWALKLEFGPRDWNLGLETGIRAGWTDGGEGGGAICVKDKET